MPTKNVVECMCLNLPTNVLVDQLSGFIRLSPIDVVSCGMTRNLCVCHFLQVMTTTNSSCDHACLHTLIITCRSKIPLLPGNPFGMSANQALLAATFGKTAAIKSSGIDRYGRTRGKIFIEYRNINTMMVRIGMAWWYRRCDKTEELEA